MKSIILDTNIISTFLKIGEMKLLGSAFPNHSLTITPGVREELRAAGYEIASLFVVKLTKFENELKKQLSRKHGALGKGELECMAICLSRSILMLTNDRRAKNAALKLGIQCYDLPEILRAMKLKGVINLNKLRRIIEAIETKDNIILKNVEYLLK